MPRALVLSSQARIGAYDCLYITLAELERCKVVTADQRLLATFPAHCVLLTHCRRDLGVRIEPMGALGLRRAQQTQSEQIKRLFGGAGLEDRRMTGKRHRTHED